MWLPQEALYELASLPTLKLVEDLQPGDMFGRGYADLGYELFLLLPSNRAVSLFSGEKITFKFDPEIFFVPSFEELLHFAVEKLKPSIFQSWVKSKQITYLSLLQILKPYLNCKIDKPFAR